MIEKLSKKAFLVTAALLAAGLTFTLSTSSAFADTTTAPDGDVNSTVSLLIHPTITLELQVYDADQDPNPDSDLDPEHPHSMFVDMKPGFKSAGRFLARVSTNRDYILQVNGFDGDTTMTNMQDGTYFIPGTGCTVEADTSCWGIISWNREYTNPWLGTDNTDPVQFNGYDPIPAVPTTISYFNGPDSGETQPDEDETETPVTDVSHTGPVTDDETWFEVGISTSTNIAPGTYKGKLVVTASNI